MPADYSSTAKALAIPTSPSQSPSPERQDTHPPWSRRLSNAGRRNTTSPYALSNKTQSLKSQILKSAIQVQKKVLKTFNALALWQKILAILLVVVLNVVFILFLIYNERIFHALAPVAKEWRDLRGGWLIIWLIAFCAAFPPVMGYSTAVTISGFVYGFPNGWFIASTATVAGSTCSFIACRTILSGYVHRLVGADKRFEALALTLKHDGLKILCMIRFCPLPYSLSNGAMSTFPTVHPLSFALATAIASPKLLIHVFIGSRLAALAEDGGGKMDAGTKAINYASIVFGSILGAVVGYIIYQRTMARARELEIEELEAGNSSVSTSVLGRRDSYSDIDPAEDTDAAALMDDDDISLWDTAEDRGDGREGYRDDSSSDGERSNGNKNMK